MQTLFLGRPKKASFMGAFFMSALLMLNSAHAESCRMPSGLREAQVERVVDGDTLRLTDGRSVRMIGLNTPEKARAGKPAEPFALDAMRNQSGWSMRRTSAFIYKPARKPVTVMDVCWRTFLAAMDAV